MAKYTVEAKDFAEFFRQTELARIKRVHGAIFEAAQAGVPMIAGAAPVDMGELRRSVHAVRVSETESQLRVDAPHAGLVELGSRPHMPPFAPILAWTKRHAKGLQRSRTKGQKRRRSIVSRVRSFFRRVMKLFRSGKATTGQSPVRKPRAQLTDRQIEQIARAIQHKIAKEGIKPTHFVRSRLWHLRRILDKHVAKALRDPR